ncbi:MAG TPA: glycosyltransferase 87 family protein [Terriglobales bacterium]
MRNPIRFRFWDRRPGGVPRSRWPILIALGVLLEASFILLGRTPGPSGIRLGVLLAAASTFYLIAAAAVFRGGERPGTRARVRFIVLAAVVFRLTLLPLTPTLSHQLWRFHWDGEIQHDGFNPYQYAPGSTLYNPIRQAADAQVPAVQEAAFHGPLAELLFRWSYDWVKGVRAMKLLFVGCDLLLIWQLARGLRARQWPVERVLLYAWSPLAVFEVAGNGHLEPAAALLALLALYALERRPRWAAVAAASAALTQWYAAVLLPLVLGRAGRRWPSVVAWMVVWPALVTVPYLFMNQHFALKAMAAAAWAHARAAGPFNASVFAVAAAWFGRGGATVVAVAVMAGVIGLALARGRAADPLRSGFLILSALLLVMPQVYPWYVLWLLPLVVFWPEAPWLYFSVAVWIAYALPRHPGWIWVEYVPLYGLLLWQARPRGERVRRRAVA